MSMADVFYFSTPWKAASPIAKGRRSLRHKLRSNRKPRITASDMINTRACVAQHAEPVFCPSDASLFAHESLFRSTAIANDTTCPDLEDEEYDDEDDDDDDEDGGVSLREMDEYDDEEMLDDLDGLHTTDPAVHTMNDTIVYNADSRQELDSSHLQLTSFAQSNALREGHPRPESHDLWAEEDSRRMRFALDQGDGPQDAPQFDLEAVASHRAQFTAAQRDSNSSHRPRMRSSTSDLRNTAPTNRRRSTRPSTPLHTLEAQARESADFHDHIADDMILDIDALPVDDPRRHYDFADFMDKWRLRSVSDRRLSLFDPGVHPSVKIGRPKVEVSRSAVAAGAADMQGICWKLIGPSREDASLARALLHPSNTTTAPLSDHRPKGRHHTSLEDERHYRFRSFLPTHKAKFSHYQLRNVIAASSRNETFYATGSAVNRASLACPSSSETVMDLAKPFSCSADFHITCMSARPRSQMLDYQSDNVLIAGGFGGEYAIFNLDGASCKPEEGFVTHAFNGLVTHIHSFAERRSGLVQAAFCSNDRKLRIMDVQSLQFTNEYSYDHAINCSATSPDVRLRVLAGDSSEVLISDADRGQPLVTLKNLDDNCFACDWSQDGRYVAASAEDGKTAVWDARNWSKPVRVLDSVMSCARSLNFTDNGALVVAENDDVVRVYDKVDFEKWQELRFFGSVAGVALLDGGREIVVANGDRTVGGLLTFERTKHGGGSWGKVIEDRGSFRRRRREMMDWEML